MPIQKAHSEYSDQIVRLPCVIWVFAGRMVHLPGFVMLQLRAKLCLIPYLMCANSEGSGETAQMRSLARAFAGRLCDKYYNLILWLQQCLTVW